MAQIKNPLRRLRQCSACSGVPGIDVGLLSGRRVRWRAASQSRKAVAWVICSPANCRLEGVIGVFAARVRSLDRMSQVAKRWMSWGGGVGDRVEMGDEPALEQADLLVEAGQDAREP